MPVNLPRELVVFLAVVGSGCAAAPAGEIDSIDLSDPDGKEDWSLGQRRLERVDGASLDYRKIDGASAYWRDWVWHDFVDVIDASSERVQVETAQFWFRPLAKQPFQISIDENEYWSDTTFALAVFYRPVGTEAWTWLGRYGSSMTVTPSESGIAIDGSPAITGTGLAHLEYRVWGFPSSNFWNYSDAEMIGSYDFQIDVRYGE